LADKVGPDTLAIHTWLTDEVPSNVVLNYALWIIVPAMDVGAAAIETQGFIGDRLMGTAVGARDGTIAVSGYTKWGVIEQGFELWLTGILSRIPRPVFLLNFDQTCLKIFEAHACR